MILAKKLLRDLRAQRAQAAAVGAVGALGALMFVASFAGYENLSGSYADTRRALALADLHIDVTGVEPTELAALARRPEIARVDARLEVDLPARIATAAEGAATTSTTLRFLSLPGAGSQQPALDRLHLESGRLPHADDEIVLEKHSAEFHHAGPGATVTLQRFAVERTLRVVGVAVSAEYLWVARSPEDVMPTPDTFGVAWIGRNALRDMAHALAGALPPGAMDEAPALATTASTSLGNKLLVDPHTSSAAARAAAIAAVRSVLGDRVLAVTPEEDLVGVKLLQLDVDGLRGMAIFFPLFFLAVGAFIVASVLTRMVDAETPLIGTLRALGASRGRVLRYYLAFALILGTFGAVVGALLGVPAGDALATSYAAELGIPTVTTAPRYGLVAIAVLAGAAVATVAGGASAWRAAGLAPASAMRGASRGASLVVVKLARHLPAAAPIGLRLALRDILRRPLRSVTTAIGVAAALTLVITTSAVLESARKSIDIMFNVAQRGDLRVDLFAPEPIEKLRADVGALPGVTTVEPLFAAPVALAHDGAHVETLAQGLRDDSDLVRAVDVNRGVIRPRAGGVVLARALARKLHVSVGDTVTLAPAVAPAENDGARTAQATRAPATLRVDDLIDVPVGEVATLRLADLADALGVPGLATSAAIRTTAGDTAARRRVRDALSGITGVARVEDEASLRENVAVFMGLAWLMLGVMLTLSVVLAAAILFNTATLGILERRRELATMRALGGGMRGIAASLSLEHALLALGGVAIGIPASMALVRRALGLFTSDLMTFPVVFSPSTFACAILGGALVLFVAQWPALRSIARASLASTLRLREG